MKYILTADNHFQYNQPICRTDNFIETQIKKIQWLSDLKAKHNAIILNAGDILHKPRVEKQELFSLLLNNLPEMYGVAGNHDLMYHNLSNLMDSSIGVLISAGVYKFINYRNPLVIEDDKIYGFSYGEIIENPINISNNNIAIWHNMVFEKENNFKFTDGYNAIDVLKENPSYKLILTGDNHKTFTCDYENRYLVNPGSLTRDDAAQIDHRPCVFIYDSTKHQLEKIYVPIENNVISTKHLDIKKEKNQRLEAFVESVNSNYEIGFSFQKNLENYLSSNKVSLKIKNIIYECTGI